MNVFLYRMLTINKEKIFTRNTHFWIPFVVMALKM